MKKKFLQKNRGLTIIEVLVACIVISITVFSLMFAASKGIELSFNAIKQTQSSYLLEEGVEAVKLIRDENWNTIDALNSDGNTKYYLSWEGGSNKWILTTTSSIISNIFTREIVFNDVCRDSNSDILPRSCEPSDDVDEDIKKVTVRVSFNSSGVLNENILSFYIANIFN